MTLPALAVLAKITIPFVHHEASGADSARAIAAAAAAARNWFNYRDAWHDFFLLAGTAAVTLAGLLFVALSLHIEVLIHETHEHLLALARAIVLSFVMVLTLSLMMLVPDQSLRVTGAEIAAVALVFGILTITMVRQAHGEEHPDFPRSVFRRRVQPTFIGYALSALSGVALIVIRDQRMLFLMVSAICMLLGNAAGASWELLVRTAKIKRRAASEHAKR